MSVDTLVFRHESVDYNCAGNLVISSSSLSGRYWYGKITFFYSFEDAKDFDKCASAYNTNAGVSQVKWIDDDQFLAACDNGEILQIINERSGDICVMNVKKRSVLHDGFVSVLSLTADRQQFFSAGLDGRILRWDLEEYSPIQILNAHTDCVTDICFCHQSELTFLSCSQDNTVILWDLRKQKPAKYFEIAQLPSKVTSLAWSASCESELTVGNEDGGLGRIDLRNSHVLNYEKPHSRTITKIKFSNTSSLLIATASDDSTVCIFEPKNYSLVKTIDTHTDFVRGLSWQVDKESVLTTASWDGSILHHSISDTENTKDTISYLTISNDEKKENILTDNINSFDHDHTTYPNNCHEKTSDKLENDDIENLSKSNQHNAINTS